MRILIRYNGEEYKGIDKNEGNLSDYANAFYQNINRIDSIILELENGGFFVGSRKIIEKSVFLFIP